MRSNLTYLPVLMVLTIIAIGAFQTYWLRKAYDRERHTTEVRLHATFRETVFEEHAKKLRLDQLDADSLPPAAAALLPALRKGATPRDVRNLMAVERLALAVRPTDSVNRRVFVYREGNDSDRITMNPALRRRDRMVQLLADIEQPGDTLRVAELTAVLRRRLDSQHVAVPFMIERLPVGLRAGRGGNKITIGFRTPITFAVKMVGAQRFLLRRIALPIMLSVFLVAFTALSFWALYRTLQQQRKLAAIKSDFISNITHELKTPIATVSVAIEALRNFGASADPAKTKEYLDISAGELQRLSLLVDKVLKLSLFEDGALNLKYEPLDLAGIVDEVVRSMQLQFEKEGAHVQMHKSGDTTLQADKLHLLSVVYNLLDNALKYSPGAAFIDITITGAGSTVTLSVRDKGMGIPAAYQDKVFEKFFRVPAGNVHNTKGYGLGLSYLAHVVQKHGGTVAVASPPGGGALFTVTLPKKPA